MACSEIQLLVLHMTREQLSAEAVVTARLSNTEMRGQTAALKTSASILLLLVRLNDSSSLFLSLARVMSVFFCALL
jgi:hypothetical protein